jgi:NAD(P)-dependent dehydrogenase (short-subunit alcohol dehydrogenase family)
MNAPLLRGKRRLGMARMLARRKSEARSAKIAQPSRLWQNTLRYSALRRVNWREERMSDASRVAIVTGAAGGIGRALVEGLLGAGVRVAAVDRTRDGLAALAANAKAQGKEAALLTIEADLASDAAPPEIVGKARGHFGKIDILVNNAGVGQATLRAENWQQPIRFWEVKPDQWRLFVAVHTTAPLALASALVPDMVDARWGRIVNVTTSLGTMIRSGSPTYGPSKAALEAFSAIMSKDLDGTGVTVNVLVPGGVTNTPMVPQESGFNRQDMIQPDAMAPPLLWLVSDAAADVTGRRFLAVHWDTALPPAQAAEKAGAPVAWTSIATMPIEPARRS